MVSNLLFTEASTILQCASFLVLVLCTAFFYLAEH